MIENHMMLYSDCDNPFETEHRCKRCCSEEYFDEPHSYKEDDEDADN